MVATPSQAAGLAGWWVQTRGARGSDKNVVTLSRWQGRRRRAGSMGRRRWWRQLSPKACLLREDFVEGSGPPRKSRQETCGRPEGCGRVHCLQVGGGYHFSAPHAKRDKLALKHQERACLCAAVGVICFAICAQTSASFLLQRLFLRPLFSSLVAAFADTIKACRWLGARFECSSQRATSTR
jgi:hypothetical protein